MHIEFNGLPGSGKTGLYRRANEYLEGKLGYKPGPEYVWTKMLQDPSLNVGVIKEVSALKALRLRFSRIFRGLQFVPERVRYWTVSTVSEEEMTKACNYDRLMQFILANREYFYRVLEAYPEQKYAEEWDEKYIHLNLEYFLILATHYQSFKMDQNRTWVMYDEGFYRDAVKYVVDDDGNPVERGTEILKCAPDVDILFYVDTDIETCISRMKTRPAGIPTPYRKFASELPSVLAKEKRREDGFSTCLERIGKRVVQIDNNRSIDESFAEVATHLNQLYEEHDNRLCSK